MFQLKNHSAVIFHDNEESCKIWRKADMWFDKWHEEFGKFSTVHWKVSNWYFLRIFLSKGENAWATTYRGFISNDTEKWWKIWRGIDLSLQSWHKEFDNFWLENLKVSKIYTLMGCFWPKFELKKYRGAIFHDNEESCKIWRKADMWFEKWHEEFGKFWTEHSKVSKLVFSWDLFVQRGKCMSYNLQRIYK